MIQLPENTRVIVMIQGVITGYAPATDTTPAQYQIRGDDDGRERWVPLYNVKPS